jgi:hypothetical protein
MNYFKKKTFRARWYLDWVKQQPSAISGLPADDPHHLIGHCTGGTKASDLLTFPLTRIEHGILHGKGYQTWEKMWGSQWKYVSLTLALAIESGIFKKN